MEKEKQLVHRPTKVKDLLKKCKKNDYSYGTTTGRYCII